MDRYFAGEEFSVTEISAALSMCVGDGSLVPVCMGSPVNLQGVKILLDDICGYFPSPNLRERAGIVKSTSEIFEADYDFTMPKSAQVFKTIVDPFIGKYSLLKVCSGVIKSGDTLYNVEREEELKIGKLYVMEGSKPIEVPELHAGDIGAVAKINELRTGDTLATKAVPVFYGKPEISTPYTCKRYKAVNKADMDKISQALSKMCQEDLTMKVVNDSANRQTLLYGMGDQHIDVIVSKLQEQYKVNVELSKPKVAFRETIRKKSDIDKKYKKQSGGHGQYGHVKMTFEPSGDLEQPYVFEQCVVGGAAHKGRYHFVLAAVQAEYRQVAPLRIQLQVLAEGRGIGGQCQQPAQRPLPAQEGAVIDHCAALGEAGEDDACRVDAAVALRFDQADHRLGRGLHLLLVDGPCRAHGQDVVPAGHAPAAVDGDRPGRRLR